MGRKIKDSFLLGLIYLTSFLSVILLAGILLYVFVRGFPGISRSFLTTVSSMRRGTVGIAGNLVNTCYLVALTLMIAVPIGIGSVE